MWTRKSQDRTHAVLLNIAQPEEGVHHKWMSIRVCLSCQRSCHVVEKPPVSEKHLMRFLFRGFIMKIFNEVDSVKIYHDDVAPAGES